MSAGGSAPAGGAPGAVEEAPPAPRGGGWTGVVLRACTWFLVTVAGAATLVQLLLAAAPGDAIDLLPDAAGVRETLAREWGLDQPVPVRILRSLGGALQGDLGISLSYRPGTPVTELLAGSAPDSLLLLVAAQGVALLLALGAAAWTSGGERRAGGTALRALSVVPAFLAAFGLVTGLNALVWAGMERGWWERPDFFALPDQPSLLRLGIAVAVLAVASGNLAALHTTLDAELRSLRDAPFVEAARARGAPALRHLAWNLLPVLLDAGAGRVAAMLGSVVVVEKLLLLNGAGAMLWQACRQRDVPLAMGVVLAAAALVAAVRLLVDLARAAVDPRLRGAR